jgi:hypothetical protein
MFPSLSVVTVNHADVAGPFQGDHFFAGALGVAIQIFNRRSPRVLDGFQQVLQWLAGNPDPA